MAQFARPSSDIAAGNWTKQDGTTTTNLYQSIDEASPDDGDYLMSGPAPDGDAVEVGLSAVTDPGGNTGYVARYHIGKAGPDRIDQTVSLMQGATEIAAWVHSDVAEGFAAIAQTLTAGQADAITDFAALSLRNVASLGDPTAVPLALGLTHFWHPPSQLVGVADATAVSTIANLGTAGGNATQATSGRQPTVQTAAGIGKVVRHAGTDDVLEIPAYDFTGTDKLTVFGVAAFASGADQMLWELSSNASDGAQELGAALFRGTDDKMNALVHGNGGYNYTLSDRTFGTDFAWVLATYDKALSGASGETRVWVNGTKSIAGPTSTTENTNAFGNLASYIGARFNASSPSIPLTGDWACVGVAPRVLTQAEIETLDEWVHDQFAFFVPFTPTDLAFNAYSSVVSAPYYRSSPGAIAPITTDATSIEVDVYSDLDGTVYDSNAEFGVRENGADKTTVAMTGARQIKTVTLAAGSAKAIDVIAGMAALDVTVKGTYVKSITTASNKATSRRSVTTSPLIVVYGDSIAVGANATNTPLEAWFQLVRNAYAGGLRVEAWGSRSLNDDATGSNGGTANVTALAAQLNVGSPANVWLAIGTNDYGIGGGLWSAASFGTSYAALLDAIHAGNASASIWCASPIQRIAPAGEGANSLGSTLANYRTQISSAASARSSYCTYKECGGGAVVSDANMDTDGVHPLTAGHAQYAAFVKTTLGIP